MTVHILTHADSDGRYAKFCAHAHFDELSVKFGEAVVFSEVQYGRPIPLSPEKLSRGDAVYIMDFSYPRDTLIELSKRVGVLVVLDHHASAMNELRGIEDELDKDCSSEVIFDMTKSGALLAWEYFHYDQYMNPTPPLLCRLVNDRDLWRFEYGDDTRALECYLRSIGEEAKRINTWSKLSQETTFFKNAMAEGHRILKFERDIIQNFISNPQNYEEVTINIFGEPLTFLIYEGMGILHSEIAEGFYTENKGIDFTLEWRRKASGKMVFSLRTARDNVDLSKIVKFFDKDGGGHQKAAGFTKELTAGFELLAVLYKAVCK